MPEGPVLPATQCGTADRDDADDLAARLLLRATFPAAPVTAAGGPWPLAVSGGADSLALLILASRAGLHCTAIHVDHGLRPGSAFEGDVVAAAAERYGARFERLRVVVPPGPDLEARARRARYDVLPPGVLTGHTMDDQAETILIALLRGAGLDGLAGMRADPTAGAPAAAAARSALPAGDSPAALPRRPMLQIRRRETASLCAAEGLTPVADPSNDDPRFVRNRVRHELVPLMADIAGRDVVAVLARQAELLADDGDLLDYWAATLDPTDGRALRAAPVALARRAIRRWLRSPAASADPEGHPPSSAEVARVLDVAFGRAVACEIAGGRRVWRQAGRLGVGPR